MSIIEKNISNFIETQFPEIYREEGPVFVEFVKKYYEWLESSNNAIYHSRRMLEYKDIDETVDDFVLKFKQKYLADIQFDTVSQTRQLIKHSLDLYRSKGTERSVDLFFRAVFGKPAEVYYPGEDIFRLSDGKWVKPKYLEVTPSDFNVDFVGKQIVGVNTGATAFVERYIRRKVKKKYINIFYISAIRGEFETGELISLYGQSLKNLPTVIGSMTTLEIIAGGEDFKIGDIVSLTSNNGLQGKARVTSISDIVGIVEFNLEESGWGYSTNSEILVSEKVLTLANVQTIANTTNTQFEIFETIKQPLANIVYINANNTFTPNTGNVLYTYYSNNTVAGMGVVLSATTDGSTNGEIYVVEKIGTLGPVEQPAASNGAGSVYITPSVGVVNGYSNVVSGCNIVRGTSTAYNAQFGPGVIIEFFEYAEDSNIKSFNANTNVNGATDFISLANNTFVNNSVVLYYTGVGNTAISGLSNNTNYYVTFANSSGVQLSLTKGGTAENITASSISESGHFLKGTGKQLIGTETRRVTAIANSTQLTVDSPFTVNSNFVLGQIVSNRIIQGTGTNFTGNFVYGDKIAIYTNSTSYFLRTVNAVTNATFMTIQEAITVANASANYATVTSNMYIYNSSNTIVANIQSRTDRSVTANVMGIGANLILYYANSSGTYSNGQYIYQLGPDDKEIANARIITNLSRTGANGSLTVNTAVGVFRVNSVYPIRLRNANGVNANVTANLVSVDMQIGVMNIAGSFITSDTNFIYGLETTSNATVTRISTGVFADFEVSNTLQFSETITTSSEKIKPYANLALNAYAYGFVSYPSANVTQPTLDEVFDIKPYTMGGISTLSVVNPGKNYDYPPFVTIYDPLISSYGRTDYNIEIANTTGIFTVGELVEQNSVLVGQVRRSNGTVVVMKRLKFENTIALGDPLVGVNSGVTANVVAVSEIENIEPIGLNAIITSNVQTGVGSVTSLEVIDSGYGYTNGEIATFTSGDGVRSGLSKVYLGKKGVSEGYYRNKNGFLSDSKYIFDGEYYQDYSYEVRTAVTADKYAEMLKNVLHVAGTKAFYAVIVSEKANTSTNIISDITEE